MIGLKSRDYFAFMFCSESFQRNAKLHGGVPVRADELVMLQLNDIALLFGNDLRDADKLTRFIRQKHGNRKNTVSLNQAVLHNGGHRDYIHD